MSKFIACIAAVALVLCASAASAQTTIKIDGSTGAMPLVAALAKAYEARTPGLTVDIGKGLGTKARIDALKSGGIDIAVASHGLKADELTKDRMNVDEIARTPVVFAVNAGVAVTNLSHAQVCAIYSGQTANWKELGGGDMAIAARTRPDQEVDAEVARDGVTCLKTLKMPEAVKVMPRGGDMAKELAAAAGAIGMTTTTVAEQSGGKIKALSLDGVAPTESNVTAGKYRLVREVFLVTDGNAAPTVKSFLAFVMGPDGAKVIKANGAISK